MAGNKYTIEVAARDRTKSAFNSIDRSVSKLEKNFSGMNAAIAGIAGGILITGLVRTGKAALDAADRIQKLSQQTGASAEFLSEMRYAAELSGTSFEQFSKAITKMQKSAADAAAGLSTPKRAFELLGISVDDFIRMSPEQQFDAMARGLDGVENSSLKTQIAMDIMGRSGRDMLSMMNEGSDGIMRMREEAASLGYTLSQDAANSAAAANDAMTKLGTAFDSAAQAIAISLAPAITEAIELLMDLFGATKKFDGFYTKQGMLGDKLGENEERMKAIRKELSNLNLSTAAGAQRAQTLGAEYNRLSISSSEYIRQIDEANQQETKAARAKEKAAAAAGKTTSALDKLTASQDKSNKKTKDAKTDMERFEDSLISAQKAIDSMADKEMVAFEMWETGKIGIEAYQEALSKLGHEMPEIAESTKQTAEKSTDYWGNMVDNTQKAFGDLIYNNIKSILSDGEVSFKEFTDAILDMFIRMIADMAAAWAAQAIFGKEGAGGLLSGLGGLFGGSGGSGGGSIMSSAGSALGGIGGKVAGMLGLGGGGAVSGLGTGAYAMTPMTLSGGATGGGGLASLAGVGEKIASGFKSATASMGGLSTAMGVAGAAAAAFMVANSLLTESVLEQKVRIASEEFGILTEQMNAAGVSATMLGEQAQLYGEVGGSAFVAVNDALANTVGLSGAFYDSFGALQQAIEGTGSEMVAFTNESGQQFIKLSGNVDAAKNVITQMGAGGTAALSAVARFTDMTSSEFFQLKAAVEATGGSIDYMGDAFEGFSGTVRGSMSSLISLQNQFGSALRASASGASSLAGAIRSIPSPPNLGASLGGSLPGFKDGGSFMVGGGGGTDSQLVAFRATPGERVTVETPEQQQSGTGGTGGAEQTINISFDAGGLERFIRVVSDDVRVRVSKSGLRSNERVYS